MKYKFYSEKELKNILETEVKSLKEKYKESDSEYINDFLNRADFNVEKIKEEWDLSNDALNPTELKHPGFISYLTEGKNDPAVIRYANYTMLMKLHKEDIETCEEERNKLAEERMIILRENNNRNDFNRNWFQKRFAWSRFSENKFHKEQWRKANECEAKRDKLSFQIQKNYDHMAVLDEKCRVFELRYEESNKAGGYNINKSINDAVNKPVFNGGWGYTDANRKEHMAKGLKQAQRNAWEDEIKTRGIVKHEKLNPEVLSKTNAKFDVKAYSREEYKRNKAVQLQKKESLEKIKKDEISRKELVKTAYLKEQAKKEEKKALYREIDKKEAVRTERFKSDYLKDQEKKEAKKETAMIFRIKLRMEGFLRTQRIKSDYVRDQMNKQHLKARSEIYKEKAQKIKNQSILREQMKKEQKAQMKKEELELRTQMKKEELEIRGEAYKEKAQKIKNQSINYRATAIKAKTTYLDSSNKITLKQNNEDRISGRSLYELNGKMDSCYMNEQIYLSQKEEQRKPAQEVKVIEPVKTNPEQTKQTTFGFFSTLKKNATEKFNSVTKTISSTFSQNAPSLTIKNQTQTPVVNQPVAPSLIPTETNIK